MKKTILLFGILCTSLLCCGCFNKSNSQTINTTIYPITFITKYLYPEADVNSIYPVDADINDYRLTKKQLKNYAESKTFIYNGLTTEKEIAKDLRNANTKIIPIDASEKINYKYSLEELWLSPNNFLMLTKNIKHNLIKTIENQEIIRNIEINYKNLENEVSVMDAKLRAIVKDAKENNKPTTLIISDNVFKYLEKYGFDIISLDESENISENNLNNIKNNFKNEKYKYILTPQNKENTELINSLINEYKAQTTKVSIMYTLTKDDEAKNENYLTLMNTYIDSIRSIILK